MATNYSSGQYEDAYDPRKLQNWNRPRVCKEHPSAREGYTQFIANDRGHLLPSVPRSKASPWGTYVGTWDMPLKIPPAKVDLTSRSVAAAAHLTDWVKKSTTLTTACNGLTPQITGKPNDPPPSAGKEASAKRSRPFSGNSQKPGSNAKMPEDDNQQQGATTPKGPLSRQPGCMDIRIKDDASPDIPASPQPLDATELKPQATSEIPLSRQPGSIDVRLKDTAAPKIPAPSRPSSREPAPRRATSAESPPSGRPRSLEGKPKGVSSPELSASHRLASMKANPRRPNLPETPASNRPVTKGSKDSEVKSH